MPYDPGATRQNILGTALSLFASDGYDKVTLRAIASAAGVRLSLLQYHFGTKEQLYRAVWQEHQQVVAASRMSMLEDVDFDRPPRRVVRQLLASFVAPMLERESDPDWQDFSTLIAREAADPRESERRILEEFLDPTARRYMAAFKRALPALSAHDVAWGYQMTIGALLMHIVDVARLTRLTNGRVKSRDAEAALPRMLDFLTAGWLELTRKAAASSA